jgi:acyl-CoA hydrolase
MIAINSAVEIDLTGQVVADSIGERIYSGIGGQMDFIHGARLSPGGKAIIALPSTARGGMISRIVPRIAPGAGVVTTRGHVQYVATEYGVVNLDAQSVRWRAELLMSIAHPDFRPELAAAALGRHFSIPNTSK